MLIDSHCHLEYEGLVDDQGGVLARARAAGVQGFLNISTKQAEWDQVVATAAREDDVWASVGIHPHNADGHADLARETLLDATHHPKVVGIGETGLDYFYDKSDRTTQQALFRMHIDVARETGLPLIIHTRDAEEDTAAILEDEMGKGTYPALIHCFTASAAFGQRVLDLGLTISISGIVTFTPSPCLAGAFSRTKRGNCGWSALPALRRSCRADRPRIARCSRRRRVRRSSRDAAPAQGTGCRFRPEAGRPG